MRYPHAILAAVLTVGAATPLSIALSVTSASAASMAVWDRGAASSGNWSINSGNDFFGGLQFTAGTWAAFGGEQYAASAHLASKEHQILIPEKVLAVQGPGAWPAFSVKAGLTAEIPAPDRIRGQAVFAQPVSSGWSPSKASAPVISGVITTPYLQAGAWAAGFHTGVDFAVPIGTPIKSITSGTVVSARWDGAYGNVIIIRHDDGMYSLYAHLSQISVTAGQRTTPSQEIGLSGSTGNSTGPHLHLEIRTSNTYSGHTDPIAYLRSLGINV
jgi:murein DD-endopeptidase MepM/ murein hydrolase activator NlpD